MPEEPLPIAEMIRRHQRQTLELPTVAEQRRRLEKEAERKLQEIRRRRNGLQFVKWFLRVLIVAPLLLLPALLAWSFDWVEKRAFRRLVAP